MIVAPGGSCILLESISHGFAPRVRLPVSSRASRLYESVRVQSALVAQLDRALPSEGKGWWFESTRGRFSDLSPFQRSSDRPRA